MAVFVFFAYLFFLIIWASLLGISLIFVKCLQNTMFMRNSNVPNALTPESERLLNLFTNFKYILLLIALCFIKASATFIDILVVVSIINLNLLIEGYLIVKPANEKITALGNYIIKFISIIILSVIAYYVYVNLGVILNSIIAFNDFLDSLLRELFLLAPLNLLINEKSYFFKLHGYFYLVIVSAHVLTIISIFYGIIIHKIKNMHLVKLKSRSEINK
jgi:hypothetical protein